MTFGRDCASSLCAPFFRSFSLQNFDLSFASSSGENITSTPWTCVMMLWITSPMFGFAPLASLMAWLHSFGLMPIARKNPKISSLSLVSLPRTTKIVLFLVVLTGLAFAARALGASWSGAALAGAGGVL